MKSVKFSALVAVAVIAASCAKEGTHSVDESNKVALEPMCIEASDESQTKTVLVEKSVNWTEGDEIAVYSNIDYTTGYRFPATEINGNSATFNGEVPVGTESFFAVYPPESVRSVNAEGVTVNIPADQTPAEGTFAEEHNITVAQGTKTPGVPSVGTITFNNVCSYVKFTVPAYVSDVNKVTITSGNAIAGDFSTASSSIVSNGTNSISMSGSFGAGNTFLFVIAPGTVSNFRIDITADNGNWTRTVSKGFTATAGVPTNLKTIDFKQVALTATASHVYQGGTLVGTDLSVNLGLDGFLKYASDIKFDVKKGSTTVRSYSSASVASSTVSLTSTAYADYPYLPKGDYTIEGSYSRQDGSTQAISGTFTVAAPTFTVNAPVATTNYDTYVNSGAAAANAKDGSTIYGVAGNGVSISDDILAKYPSLVAGYSFTIDGNPASAGDNANQAWAAHEVVAKFNFDGVENSSSALTCHVTGLPYTAAPPTNNGTNAWSITQGEGKISFNSNNVTLGSSGTTTADPTIKSPLFYIPAGKTIDVIATSNVDLFSNKVLATYDCTLTIALNGKTASQKSSSTSGTSHTINLESQFSSDINYITYSTDGRTRLSGKCNINKVELSYR